MLSDVLVLSDVLTAATATNAVAFTSKRCTLFHLADWFQADHTFKVDYCALYLDIKCLCFLKNIDLVASFMLIVVALTYFMASYRNCNE